MRRRPSIAKKPAILAYKAEIANLIKKHKDFKNDKVFVQTYWRGHIDIGKFNLYIYFQYYVRRIGRIDFIHIRHALNHDSLTKTELRELELLLKPQSDAIKS